MFSRQVPTTLRRVGFQPSRTVLSRPFHQTTRTSLPTKGTQDRESINTESTEHSKSGGDAAAANTTAKTAFDPNSTRPEEEHDDAGREASKATGSKTNNPLDVSAANPEVSQTRGSTEGGAQGSEGETGSQSERARTSGGSSALKSG